MLGRWLADGHELSGLDSEKSEWFFEPFAQLPTLHGWDQAVTGAGTLAGVAAPGGVIDLNTGGIGTVTITRNTAGIVQWFSRYDLERWFFAARVRVPNALVSTSQADLGWVNAGVTVPVGVGLRGAVSLTDWQIVDGLGGVATIGAIQPASYQTLYLWHRGDGSMRASLDGVTSGVLAAPSAITGAKQRIKVLQTAANTDSLLVDAALWIGPSTIT